MLVSVLGEGVLTSFFSGGPTLANPILANPFLAIVVLARPILAKANFGQS